MVTTFAIEIRVNHQSLRQFEYVSTEFQPVPLVGKQSEWGDMPMLGKIRETTKNQGLTIRIWRASSIHPCTLWTSIVPWEVLDVARLAGAKRGTEDQPWLGPGAIVKLSFCRRDARCFWQEMDGVWMMYGWLWMCVLCRRTIPSYVWKRADLLCRFQWLSQCRRAAVSC